MLGHILVQEFYSTKPNIDKRRTHKEGQMRDRVKQMHIVIMGQPVQFLPQRYPDTVDDPRPLLACKGWQRDPSYLGSLTGVETWLMRSVVIYCIGFLFWAWGLGLKSDKFLGELASHDGTVQYSVVHSNVHRLLVLVAKK
jgi:hypothetical protein